MDAYTSFLHQIKQKLAIHPLREEGESFDGWIERIAYLNCLTTNQLFEECNFIKEFSALSTSRLPYDIAYSIGFEYQTRFTKRFCPKCFMEARSPFYKREWDYPWVKHCVSHGVPLIQRCLQCHSNEVRGLKPWKAHWMACSNCIQQSQQTESGNSQKHVEVISPIVKRIINLVEKECSKADKIELLFTLAECVSCDFSYHSQHNYHLLRKWGVEPLDYSTSNIAKHYMRGRRIDGLSEDQALACAWNILHKSPQVIEKMTNRYRLYGSATTKLFKQYLKKSSSHYTETVVKRACRLQPNELLYYGETGQAL